MVWRLANIVDVSRRRFGRVAAGMSFDWNRVVRHDDDSLWRSVIVTSLFCKRL